MEMNDAIVAVLQATAILSIKMWLCGTITTYVRGKTMQSPNREDGPVMSFFNRVFFVPAQKLEALPDNRESDPSVNRWLRICNNDTANIPIGLIVLFLAALFATLDSSALWWLTWIFVVARLAHTLFYALALQPFRTLSYAVGATCVLVAAVSLFGVGF